MSAVEPGKKRLFFALWPDRAVLEKLAKLCSMLELPEGKPVEVEKLHVTLLFLGEIPEGKIEDLKRLAGKLSLAPCQLTFDRLEHWVRPAVLCLTAKHVPESLAELVKALKREVRQLGFKPEKRFFQPHLTLARKVKKRVTGGEIEPIDWPVHEFTLVASELSPEGARYQVLDRWEAS